MLRIQRYLKFFTKYFYMGRKRKDIKNKKLFKLALELSSCLPKKFYLAGGTALMFKYNHRRSIDLDFFADTFSFQFITNKIRKKFGKRISKIHLYRDSDNIDFIIDDVKVSIVKFYFKNIKRIEKLNGLRIASDEDLVLNKFYGITRRAEAKDVFDIVFILKKKKYSFEQIKKMFKKKFGVVFDESIKYLIRFKDYNLNKIYNAREKQEIIKFIKNWVKESKIKEVKK